MNVLLAPSMDDLSLNRDRIDIKLEQHVGETEDMATDLEEMVLNANSQDQDVSLDDIQISSCSLDGLQSGAKGDGVHNTLDAAAELAGQGITLKTPDLAASTSSQVNMVSLTNSGLAVEPHGDQLQQIVFATRTDLSGGTAQQSIVKRPSDNTSQVVKKLLVTKNIVGQQQSVPAGTSLLATNPVVPTSVSSQLQSANLNQIIVERTGTTQRLQAPSSRSPSKIITMPQTRFVNKGGVLPTTPTKLTALSGGVLDSPNKTPPRLTLIASKSPQKIAPAPGQFVVVAPSSGSGTLKAGPLTMSPSKVIIKGQPKVGVNKFCCIPCT